MKRFNTLFGLGLLLTTALTFGLISNVAEGAVPQLINFQGILKDGSGNPVANGSYSVIFTIYDAPAGGSVQWAETTSVTTSSGLFSVLLGSLNPVPDSAFNDSSRYLGIKVGADPEMTPRQRVATVGYAYQAGWNTNAGGDIYRASGNVGIGTTSPHAPLELKSPIDGEALRLGYSNSDYHFLSTGYHGIQAGLNYLGFDLETSSNTTSRVMTLRGNGNVGIGTSSPTERLTVAGSMEVGTSAGDYQHLRIGGGNSSGFLYGSYPHFGDGIHMGYNYYADATGANQILNPGGGTSRISMSYGSIALATRPSFGGEPVDRLFVSSSGKVGVGTTAPVAALHVEIDGAATATGSAIWGRNTAISGVYFGVYGHSDSPSGYDFMAGGPGVNYGNPSSIRWKRNIRGIDDPLGKIARMRGIYFDWDEAHGGHHDLGMIAEEVGAVLPEIVNYEPNGIDANGMDYSMLTPLLVQAVNALRGEKDAEMQSIREENAQLRAQLAALSRRVQTLEQSASR